MWYTIPKFTNYEINKISLEVRHKKKLKIKSCYTDENGYLKVNLSDNGKHTKRCLHQLVGYTFVPNPENKPELHHIDENKLNNRPENLMWVTRKEHAQITKDNEQNAHKISKKDVVFIRDNYSHDKRQELATQFKVSTITIYNVAIRSARKDVKDGKYNEPLGITKKIVNIETKETYKSAEELSLVSGIKIKEIRRMLSGERYNKTPYRYLGEEYKSIEKPQRPTPIAIFDKDWNYIKSFTNISIAEKELKTVGIYDFLNGKSSIVKGYKFKRIDGEGNYIEPIPFVSKKPPLKPKRIKLPVTPSKALIKFTKDGKEVRQYSSIGEAARDLKVNKRNFKRQIRKSPRGYYKGFIYRYAV